MLRTITVSYNYIKYHSYTACTGHKPVSQTKCDAALQEVKQLPVTEPLAGLPLVSGGTIVVRGFQHPISKEMMELYFTNSLTSGGGDITDIVIDVMTTKEVFIVFDDHKGLY